MTKRGGAASADYTIYDKSFLRYWGRKPGYDEAAQCYGRGGGGDGSTTILHSGLAGGYIGGGSSSSITTIGARFNAIGGGGMPGSPGAVTSAFNYRPNNTGRKINGVPIAVGMQLARSANTVQAKINYGSWTAQHYIFNNYSPAYKLNADNRAYVDEGERMVIELVKNALQNSCQPVILSQELSDNLKACWASIDVDGSGVITMEDFEESIPAAKRLKRKALNNLRSYLDIDGDGNIACYEEFLQCIILRAMRRDTSTNSDYRAAVRDSMQISDFFMAVLSSLQSCIQLEIDVINYIYNLNEVDAENLGNSLTNTDNHNKRMKGGN